jgi:large conductance mechanosensitive channel
MSLLKEFKEFAAKGNVIDLAVGVIIGASFGKIVTSLVADIVMPLINPLTPGGDWRKIEIGNGIKIGSFMGMVLDFLIVAFVIFLLIKTLNKMKKKDAALPEEPKALTKQEALLTEIRDLLKNKS